MKDIDVNLSYKIAKIIYKTNNGEITSWRPATTLAVPTLPVPDFAFHPEIPGEMVITFQAINEGPAKQAAVSQRGHRTTYTRPMDLHFHFPTSLIQVEYFPDKKAIQKSDVSNV